MLSSRSGNEQIPGYSLRVAVSEASQVGEARREAAALAARLGFDETQAGKLAIIVTEAANNLLKHGRGGELVLTLLTQGANAGIEILALDKGPGMDLTRCLRDGYSTAGTPGTGLGAISRLAAFFDLHSSSALGTVLVARLWAMPFPSGQAIPEVQVGAICIPVAGETVSGDAFALECHPGRLRLLVADGLGHGALAATASRLAVTVFHDCADQSPVQLFQAIHAALRSTRGAAVALADVDFDAESVQFTGVGNIAGIVLSAAGGRSMVSHNGTLGHQLHKIQEFAYAFPAGALLVMHSDGLTSQCRLEPSSGLLNRDPSLLAGILYRDFKRPRDDVTVVVARQEKDGLTA